MFNSVILEVAIGIIFLFGLVSMICSAIREGIEAITKTRAAYLERGIRELLHDRDAQNVAKSFFEHPMINSLFTADYTPGKNTKQPGLLDLGKRLPSYIPSKNFALALMDIAARGSKNNAVSSDPNAVEMSIASIRANILNIQNIPVQRAMLTALDTAQGDLDRLQQNLEKWFDSSMDRVSGWYKRSTQWILFIIGLVVAVGLNINTIKIADYLFRNDDARKLIVAQAENASKDATFTQQSYDQAKANLDALQLPIGWANGINPEPDHSNSVFWNGFFIYLLGWLLTAFAATLGAPFWFDMLNKIMVIRGTVKPSEKSPEEGSEDRQNDKPNTVTIQLAGANGVDGTHVIKPSNGNGVKPAPQEGAVMDPESDVDTCVLETEGITSDEDLPQAEGGISK
ncbi:hypothetical protein [Chitinophaga filiformis]|uniref:Uncharacterized protein n=1 Tax=Chitinophaga filiformis TaxID=104663 RepID=A0A1G8BHB1_CHIFI|nr:hypothetical protein [Chitinophaga filiformis]SDH32632.1 hypothetical protein SAMN04488121_11146 [Chitinophaga filiformis]